MCCSTTKSISMALYRNCIWGGVWLHALEDTLSHLYKQVLCVVAPPNQLTWLCTEIVSGGGGGGCGGMPRKCSNLGPLRMLLIDSVACHQ